MKGYHVFYSSNGAFTDCRKVKFRKHGVWLTNEPGHWFFVPYYLITEIHKYRVAK